MTEQRRINWMDRARKELTKPREPDPDDPYVRECIDRMVKAMHQRDLEEWQPKGKPS